MKATQVSHQLGHASQSLFATSLGASVVLHGMIIVWMLSGSGPSRPLLADLPAFHSVSLVDAPGPPAVAEPVANVPEPQAISEPAAVPEAVNPTAANLVPETTVQPAQAKQATEVPETSVEAAAPVAKPEPVEVPEAPSVVETQLQKPKPVKATEKRSAPAPTPASADGPTLTPTEVAAALPGTTPTPAPATQPRTPASRNSPQAAQRARETIENLRAQSGAQGTSTNQSPGGVAASMQDLLLRTYEQRVRARIINAWHLPIPEKMAQGLQAIALLTIDREGQVIRYELTRSSGNPSFDASLHRAVQASLPLPELPDTFRGETQELRLRFTPPAS